MKIKYIAWKRITCGDAQRILYKIKGGKDNSKDHAIQAFCSKSHENPGLWTGLTNGIPAPQRTKRGNESFSIVLENSVNTLDIWQDNNAGRNSPIKIAQRIWNDKNPGDVIEVWYVAYMRIIAKLLDKIIESGRDTEDTYLLRKYIVERLEVMPENILGLMDWVITTQNGFCELELDTSAFLTDAVISDLKSFVDNYYYVVFRYEDDGEDKNAAVVANVESERLHPTVKRLLETNEKGGDFVDITVSGDSIDVETSEIISKLYKEKNIILYGAPGTGKTRLMTKIKSAFSQNTFYDCLDTEAPISLLLGDDKDVDIKWCTFHPDYTYENFVWGLNPKVIGGKLGYTYHKGPFAEEVIESQKGKKTLLIIDEINRANTDDVFGDTIHLLDKRNRGKVEVPVPSQLHIPGDKMKCTEDFYVIGTMNSLDKSVSPLTVELKRVFSIIEVNPNEKALSDALYANENLPKAFSELVIKIWKTLNNGLSENVGKEYVFGQGYFWDLVNSKEDYESTFADILRHKVMPHIKDVYPEEHFVELFKPDNHDILYRQIDGISEVCNIDGLCDGELIAAFAKMCNSHYDYTVPEAKVYTTFVDYEKACLDSLYRRLEKYKNIILAGPSGTGKSTMLDGIRKRYDFDESEVMFWHNSTSYDDVIEGISAVVTESGDDIEYSYKSGSVKALADKTKDKKSLMGIENLDKSDAGENFGELITLLEPDKRKDVSVEGFSGRIQLPEEMHFLCTMSPISLANNKMDSALKRRFVILEMHPDYQALCLWFGVENNSEPYIIKSDTKYDRLKLAVELLRALNRNIANAISIDAQIGHTVMWGLKDTNECSMDDISEVFDETIIPMIEEYCVDSEIAYRIFGESSPIIRKRNYGVELVKFKNLKPQELENAIKELIDGEI